MLGWQVLILGVSCAAMGLVAISVPPHGMDPWIIVSIVIDLVLAACAAVQIYQRHWYRRILRG